MTPNDPGPLDAIRREISDIREALAELPLDKPLDPLVWVEIGELIGISRTLAAALDLTTRQETTR